MKRMNTQKLLMTHFVRGIDSVLEIKNISMNYHKNKEDDFILKDINFTLEEGECVAIVGSSGCGKTTLLNIISGILEPTEGEVLFEGKSVKEANEDIAVVFQGYGLFPWKTVRKNVLLPLRLKHQKDMYEVGDKMISKLGLDHVKNRYPSQLSGGQKQRVAIARALLSYSKIILMDEPFSALDPMMRDKLCADMRKYFKLKNMMAIIVTHSVKEAVYFGDKILVLSSEGDLLSQTIKNKSVGSIDTDEVKDMQHRVQRAMGGGY